MTNTTPRQHVTWVTGGTRGIGHAIAAAFAERGDRVVVSGLAAEECEQARRDHPDWTVHQLDVRDAKAVQDVADALPQLNVLVNAAGMILRDKREHDLSAFERVIDVNLTGAMRVATACHRHLTASHGCVLNLASMLSFFGSGYVPAYSASKGGIAQLTKSLAIAWAEDRIRVNAIAPGWIKTAMTAPLVGDPQRSQSIIDRTPLARWGETGDITGPALFLCSPAANFITGAILPVDGGYSIA